MQNRNILRKSALFKSLSDDEFTKCLEITKNTRYLKNQKIIAEGTVGDTLYVIVSGDIHISKHVNESEKLISSLEPGDFFGEMCLFNSGLRTANVTAIEESGLVEVKKKDFDDLINTHPTIGCKILYAMMEDMAMRLQKSNEKVIDFFMWVKEIRKDSV